MDFKVPDRNVSREAGETGVVGCTRPPGSGHASGPDLAVTRLAVEHAANAIFWITSDGRCVYANRSTCRMLGYSKDELLDTTVADLDLDFPPRRWPGFWASLRESDALEFTSVYRAKDGRVFPVEIAASLFEWDGEEYVVASAREITERRESERALREGQERLKILFEYAPDAYYLSDLGGRFVDVNRAAEELTGRSRVDLIGRSFLTLGLLDPAEVPKAARALSLNALGRPTGPGEFVLTRADGSTVWAEIRTYPLQIQGEFLILGIARDVTSRKRAEKELRLTQFTMDQAMDSVFWISMDGRFIHANEVACAELGFSVPQLQRKNVWDVDPNYDARKWRDLFDRIRIGGSETFTSEIIPGDGATVPVEVAISHLDFEGEEFAVALVRNIRERLLVNKAVERSEAEFRAIFEEAPYGILRTSKRGEVLMGNPALAEMLGYGHPRDLVGLDMGSQVWVSEEDRSGTVAVALQEGKIKSRTALWRRKDGEEITVRLSSRIVHDENGEVSFFEDMVEDISDQVRLEDQLRQAQKMEAVGQLTGGIAHDFNNLLSVILLNTELVRGSMEGDRELSLEDLQEVEDAARKAAAMTRKLLGFSRRAALTRMSVDLSGVVEEISSLLRRLLPENINLVVSTPPTAPRVEADRASIEQMILNLATNARDAMTSGGSMTIAVEQKDFVDRDTEEYPWIVPGSYVGILVRDTGVGMDGATQDRLFEPFFTTKPVGEGTGLGMAMVYGLTKQHGGFVLVNSEVDRGTEVGLYFPVAKRPEQKAPMPKRQVQPQAGTETILLVEDEDALRRSGKRVLERFGYAVLLAEDGREGLEVYRAHRNQVDLIISDMVMPRLGGAELYRALRDEGVEVPFLIVSGYTGDEATERRLLDPGVPILAKPWDIGDLLHHVRGVLDQE